jgi:hypothetical protein
MTESRPSYEVLGRSAEIFSATGPVGCQPRRKSPGAPKGHATKPVRFGAVKDSVAARAQVKSEHGKRRTG